MTTSLEGDLAGLGAKIARLARQRHDSFDDGMLIYADRQRRLVWQAMERRDADDLATLHRADAHELRPARAALDAASRNASTPLARRTLAEMRAALCDANAKLRAAGAGVIRRESGCDERYDERRRTWMVLASAAQDVGWAKEQAARPLAARRAHCGGRRRPGVRRTRRTTRAGPSDDPGSDEPALGRLTSQTSGAVRP